ncbi:hypothetical protein M4951_16190 [Blastopirellula sp. J2-11]|uniref:hypothetical protein n=1 Tax=Blastopirellula sp. J2-11 TaxID=2943192 RepID=UPI0021C6320C|nr:hypothetical protein [Blastopirellula sp. J2-11]UUO04922.1 hypothetical protein M4951_16190 [Blastopirellula sp. J2-11]
MFEKMKSDRSELFSRRIDPTFFPAIVRRLEESPFEQTALVVEFRDEAYVEIRMRLADCGWQVIRAEQASDVAACMNLYDPQLVIVNDAMPDESGCLITFKLRLNHCLPIVWLYSSQPQAVARRYGKFCGVDKVLEYDGVLQNLGEAIEGRLQRRFPVMNYVELTPTTRRQSRLG